MDFFAQNRYFNYLVILISFTFLSSCSLFSDIAWYPAPKPIPVEQEEDETNIILDPDDPGIILGKEITPQIPPIAKLTGQKFRSLTFNLHLWNKAKQQETTELIKKAGVAQKFDSAIFEMFQQWGADVIALQEVYKSLAVGSVPFKSSEGNYRTLYGKPIFTTKAGKKEYCLIIYNDKKMDCKSQATQWDIGRKIHWAECTLKPNPPKKSFYFGCAHFSPSGSKLAANIKKFFETLYLNMAPVVNGAKKDNFIIGGDYNSFYYGLQSRRWQSAETQFDNKTPKPEKLSFEQIKPDKKGGGFTKIHKRKKGTDFEIKIAKNKNKRIIDDLFWQLKPTIKYINGSKRIVPVTELKTATMTWEKFWKLYYKVSDHLPVKADFSYN